MMLQGVGAIAERIVFALATTAYKGTLFRQGVSVGHDNAYSATDA